MHAYTYIAYLVTTLIVLRYKKIQWEEEEVEVSDDECLFQKLKIDIRQLKKRSSFALLLSSKK